MTSLDNLFPTLTDEDDDIAEEGISQRKKRDTLKNSI